MPVSYGFSKEAASSTAQSGLRDRNERLVLTLLRRQGELSSAEIARRSGLSAQTVSNVVRALEGQNLITRGKAVRGKVGKPSTPVALNSHGVLSLGLNIGRRSAELTVVDFTGDQLMSFSTAYPYPEIGNVFEFLAAGLDTITREQPEIRRLAAGIGVARPNELWNWLELVNAPEADMKRWRDIDLRRAIQTATGLDALVQNDATSACVAEQLLGLGREFTDFAHIFVGAFVGGGLVLDGNVVWGRTGNTAALGPLPVPDGKGGVTQLLNTASLHILETALLECGCDPSELRRTPNDWNRFEAQLAPWLEQTANYLAIASAAISSVVEVEAVLIDGAMPKDVSERLTEQTRSSFLSLDLTGIERPKIELGRVGRSARSIGAALLPIHSRYFLA